MDRPRHTPTEYFLTMPRVPGPFYLGWTVQPLTQPPRGCKPHTCKRKWPISSEGAQASLCAFVAGSPRKGKTGQSSKVIHTLVHWGVPHGGPTLHVDHSLTSGSRSVSRRQQSTAAVGIPFWPACAGADQLTQSIRSRVATAAGAWLRTMYMPRRVAPGSDWRDAPCGKKRTRNKPRGSAKGGKEA